MRSCPDTDIDPQFVYYSRAIRMNHAAEHLCRVAIITLLKSHTVPSLLTPNKTVRAQSLAGDYCVVFSRREMCFRLTGPLSTLQATFWGNPAMDYPPIQGEVGSTNTPNSFKCCGTGMFISFRAVELPKDDYDTSIRTLKVSANYTVKTVQPKFRVFNRFTTGLALFLIK